MINQTLDFQKTILPQEILEKAKYLGSIGVENLAWNWEDAIAITNYLSGKGIFILGGDVYEQNDIGIKSTGDNWYSNKSGYLPTMVEIEISRRKSIDFITKYTLRNGGKFLFTLVIFLR